MSQPVLIGLNGLKGVGKNTTADFITEYVGENFSPTPLVVQRGFADKAKWAFTRQFFPDCTMEWAIKWVDAYKNEPNALFSSPPIGYKENGWPVDGPLPNKIPFRQAIAQFATDSGRKLYGDNFWVDQLLPVLGWTQNFRVEPNNPSTLANFCLVTDTRFPNEVSRISHLDGINIKIYRNEIEEQIFLEAEEAGREVHASELGIPDHMCDFIIDNTGGNLDTAREQTIELMDQILSMPK